MLTEITVENFRCFHEQQTARLAPLTLLVGENSTGKTSLLAMIRALYEMVSADRWPNFQAPPYDLGTSSGIAHHHGLHGTDESGFVGGFKSAFSIGDNGNARSERAFSFESAFEVLETIPRPRRRRLSASDAWLEEKLVDEKRLRVQLGTPRGSWEATGETILLPGDRLNSLPWSVTVHAVLTSNFQDNPFSGHFKPLNGSPAMNEDDQDKLRKLVFSVPQATQSLFASAPMRSVPRRTYDPSPFLGDHQGADTPGHLARLSLHGDDKWATLKSAIERFGSSAGLFDEMHVQHLGEAGGAPFQIHIREAGVGEEGSLHNLIDVGYGVSQVLPVVTELLRPDASKLSLWQQPEVHLHPSAQAALGTLFCELASNGQQIIVETHADHILDRVRMDVRDGQIGLKTEDVSILYFERTGLDVQIHSLRFDAQGNVLDAPPGYRQFFLEEVNRSLGLI